MDIDFCNVLLENLFYFHKFLEKKFYFLPTYMSLVVVVVVVIIVVAAAVVKCIHTY